MLIDVLKEKLPEFPALRVREIVVDRRNFTCTLSYPNTIDLNQATRAKIHDIVEANVPSGFYCVVKYQNDYFDERSFKKFLFQRLETDYPMLSVLSEDAVSVTKKDGVLYVTMQLTPPQMLLAKEYDFIRSFQDFFSAYSSQVVQINVVPATSQSTEEIENEQQRIFDLAVSKEKSKPKRRYGLSEVTAVIGSRKARGAPVYIADVRPPRSKCLICGTLSEKHVTASKNDPLLLILKFKVTDDSASMNVVCFLRERVTDAEVLKPTVENSQERADALAKRNTAYNGNLQKKLMKLVDGMQVAVEGRAVVSDFSGAPEIQAKVVSLCTVVKTTDAAAEKMPVPQQYVNVFPQRISKEVQQSILLSRTFSNLKGDVVVLCANVTGNNPMTDALIAVAAGKLHDGNFCEFFATFLNPETDAPAKNLDEAGIAQEKLLYYPTLTEILPDLYKFCHGCAFIGRDLAVAVLPILNYYGAPIGCTFDNAPLAFSEVLSDLYDKLSVVRKPNCSNLAEVAAKLFVSYDGSENAEKKCRVMAKCLEKVANGQLK